MTPPLLSIRDVRKTYRLGRVKVPVLHGVDLDVDEGAFVAILGASGSGKSTLLHIAGGLDRPDRNTDPKPTVNFRSEPLTNAPGGIDKYRARDVGFVFQFYHLLPELTVLENVACGAMVLHGRLGYMARRGEVLERAKALIETFGLAHRLRHRPVELSGGERQRVALARALINRPALLLADEPTGNLDRETGDQILDAIAAQRAELGLTMLMVTHDAEVAASADRVVRLRDGRLAGEADADRPGQETRSPDGKSPSGVPSAS